MRKRGINPLRIAYSKKENKYGNLSIIHHSQRLPKMHFSDSLGGGDCGCWRCFVLVVFFVGRVCSRVCSCGGSLSCGAVCRCVLGTEAVIFLLAAAFRVMFRAMPFSFLSLEAFSAGNALLFSGIRRIRYRRGPPTVRNMRAVQKTGSWGTRRIFGSIRCKKQASTVQDGYSVPETPFSGTGQARCPENSLVMHGAQFIKRRSVQGRASFFTE